MVFSIYNVLQMYDTETLHFLGSVDVLGTGFGELLVDGGNISLLRYALKYVSLNYSSL